MTTLKYIPMNVNGNTEPHQLNAKYFGITIDGRLLY